jgi:hypothetical protein
MGHGQRAHADAQARMTTGTGSIAIPVERPVTPIPRSVSETTSLSWPSRVLCTAAAILATLPVLLTPLHYEVAWTLIFSRRLLEGARPYIDIVDYKPPLVFFLSLPIEQAALLTGWPEVRVLALAVLGWTTLSLWLVWRILRVDATRSEARAVATLIACMVTLLAAVARDFGQSEHLLLIMCVPYVVWCALASTSGRELPLAWRIGIGLLASVGFALKPAFLIAYVILLAYVAWSRRRIRVWLAAEHVVIAVSVGLYALAVWLFVPDYVYRILPMAYTHDWTHGESIGTLLGDWMVLVVAGSSLGLAILAPWLMKAREWSSLVRVCAVMSLALLIAFVAQGRAIADHFLPVRAFNFLAACLAAAGLISSLAASAAAASTSGVRWILVARTCVLALVLMPSAYVTSLTADVHVLDFHNAQAGIRSPYAEPLIDIVQARAAGQPIFVMSSDVSPAFPLVNLSGATWPYRCKSLAFVSIYYRNLDDPSRAAYRRPETQSAAERAFFDETVDGLTHTPPALLIVQRARLKRGFGLVGFDFLDYYRQAPAFVELLGHYRSIARRATFEVFEYVPAIGRRES